MCLAKACVRENSEEELVMEGITLITIENERLILNSIFGEQKEIRANIREIDFLTHNGLRVKLKADIQGFGGMGEGTNRDEIDSGHCRLTDISQCNPP